MARLVISMERSMNSLVKFSKVARESFISKCFGPLASEVMNGIFTSVSIAVESSILAFSAASSSLCKANGSFVTSMPVSFLNSFATQSMIFLSISRPPRCESPSVDFTSTMSAPTSRMEISKVPPPKSYTAIFSFFFLSKP